MTADAPARQLLQSILIIGDGQLGILAAIAMKRANPLAEIRVIPCHNDPANFTANIGNAMPFTNKLHAQLGINDISLAKKAGASHKLVNRYINWNENGHDGVAGYDNIDQMPLEAFIGNFNAENRQNQNSDKILNQAEILAATGKFALSDNNQSYPTSQIDYGLRWNVPAYREMLIEYATTLGVQYAPHLPQNVIFKNNGDVDAVILKDDAGQIDADLFIDCSGPMRWLMRELPEAILDPWSDILPCDHIYMAVQDTPVLALEDHAILTDFGVHSKIGGRDFVQHIFAQPSDLNHLEVENIFKQAGAKTPHLVKIISGALKQPFVRNAIALGDTAASFQPIGGINLDLAHRHLSLLLELLPGRHIIPQERDEYNRRANLMTMGVQTWLASHYLSLPQAETPFADYVSTLSKTPQTLALQQQFTHRGRIPLTEEAPMQPAIWANMLHALSIPSQPSALYTAQSSQQKMAMIKQAEEAAKYVIENTANYLDWIRSVMDNRV
ncbi:hypothetical protein LPB140_05360 [Sphingorhabdus lutea]|uniref:Tryptophan 7-halogenase n=1 Tax=Sphingorhabdus lutea TaxID=1913578 RepID=A0A1L3JB22_9SPHN|nr:tryptophan 7-halogenase [Sphingorhabdus lutea]APG62322.1 hypothetical protein LPB140_05360 [Sphingorhabdus lutea]